MGCDIHLYREKKVGGVWKTADEWEIPVWARNASQAEVPYEKRAYTGRNYEMFGALSNGVRREHSFSFQARGLPFNCSAELSAASGEWGSDGHGHSYLYLHELRDLAFFLESAKIRITGMKSSAELAALRASIESGFPDWGKLFPYCGWTNQKGHEEFELDVPASFYIGDDLKRIIDSFDGVEGENHRIVFWFDN